MKTAKAVKIKKIIKMILKKNQFDDFLILTCLERLPTQVVSSSARFLLALQGSYSYHHLHNHHHYMVIIIIIRMLIMIIITNILSAGPPRLLFLIVVYVIYIIIIMVIVFIVSEVIKLYMNPHHHGFFSKVHNSCKDHSSSDSG